MKSWGVRLAILAAICLALFLAVRLQPWSLLMIRNTGSSPLTVQVAFQGRISISGVLGPGERRLGLFQIRGEAGMDFACRSADRPQVKGHHGYFMSYQPYVVTLDLENCDIAAWRETKWGWL